MFQYEPFPSDETSLLPRRRVTEEEVGMVYEFLDRYGIEEGFIQETEGETLWVPDFEKEIPFPGSVRGSVWHWKNGFTPA